jgi:putative membrane protein
MNRSRFAPLCLLVLSLIALSACQREESPGASAQSAADVAAVPQPPPTPPPAVLSDADRDFATRAASVGLAEVEASRMMAEKAASSDVRQFAQQMVEAHSDANRRLMKIALAKQLELPMAPTGDDHSAIVELNAAAGSTAETMYMQQFGVQGHQRAVNLFEREIKEGSDADLKGLAEDVLPSLKENLNRAQQIAAAQS